MMAKIKRYCKKGRASVAYEMNIVRKKYENHQMRLDGTREIWRSLLAARCLSSHCLSPVINPSSTALTSPSKLMQNRRIQHGSNVGANITVQITIFVSSFQCTFLNLNLIFIVLFFK